MWRSVRKIRMGEIINHLNAKHTLAFKIMLRVTRKKKDLLLRNITIRPFREKSILDLLILTMTMPNLLHNDPWVRLLKMCKKRRKISREKPNYTPYHTIIVK